MNKLAKHILGLLHKGYPVELLYNFDTAREALRQNGIEASRGQVKCAIKKHFNAIYESFTGCRIITGEDFLNAFRGQNFHCFVCEAYRFDYGPAGPDGTVRINGRLVCELAGRTSFPPRQTCGVKTGFRPTAIA